MIGISRLNMPVAAALALSAGLAAAASSGTGADRIAKAFEKRGMAAETSACYGKTIAGDLDASGTEEAARIVETASDAEEIEAGVKEAGIDMIDAFLSAKTGCGS